MCRALQGGAPAAASTRLFHQVVGGQAGRGQVDSLVSHPQSTRHPAPQLEVEGSGRSESDGDQIEASFLLCCQHASTIQAPRDRDDVQAIRGSRPGNGGAEDRRALPDERGEVVARRLAGNPIGGNGSRTRESGRYPK